MDRHRHAAVPCGGGVEEGEDGVTAIIATFASDYWFLVLVACIAVLWWAVRGLRAIGWQAVIAQDIQALLDRDGIVRVNLSQRQITYLDQWGFTIDVLEPADDGLWYSEVTQ
jgi:hypothetical protein